MTGGDTPGAGSDLRRRIDEAAGALFALAGRDGSARLIESYRRAFSAWPREWPYNRVPAEVIAVRDEARREGGLPLVAAIHRFLILDSIPGARDVLRTRPGVAPVLEWFDDAVAGMCADLAATADDRLDFPLDPFVEDLAVVLRRLWPLGAVGIDPKARLHRRWFVENGARGVFDDVRLLGRLGGSAPLYELHAYHRHLGEFTEEGWAACYRRIARIMADEPEIRGLFGKSWFWDPALERVSPRLVYLRKLPLAHGAVFLKVRNGTYTSVNALQKPETRRRLHASGEYEPQEYVMVWPRRAFLRWAATRTLTPLHRSRITPPDVAGAAIIVVRHSSANGEVGGYEQAVADREDREGHRRHEGQRGGGTRVRPGRHHALAEEG